MIRLAATFVLLLMSCGCGLRPLYGGGGAGAVAQSLRSIAVAPVEGQAGWLVRSALEKRLGTASHADVHYRIEVELDDDISGFGIRSDDSVTRERRTLRTRYRLVDSTLGTVVLDATAGSDAGIDVVSSEYATVAAEQAALERLANEIADQIVARVSLYLSRAGSVE